SGCDPDDAVEAGELLEDVRGGRDVEVDAAAAAGRAARDHDAVDPGPQAAQWQRAEGLPLQEHPDPAPAREHLGPRPGNDLARGGRCDGVQEEAARNKRAARALLDQLRPDSSTRDDDERRVWQLR